MPHAIARGERLHAQIEFGRPLHAAGGVHPSLRGGVMTIGELTALVPMGSVVVAVRDE
jgi:hypothetical protein